MRSVGTTRRRSAGVRLLPPQPAEETPAAANDLDRLVLRWLVRSFVGRTDRFAQRDRLSSARRGLRIVLGVRVMVTRCVPFRAVAAVRRVILVAAVSAVAVSVATVLVGVTRRTAQPVHNHAEQRGAQ